MPSMSLSHEALVCVVGSTNNALKLIILSATPSAYARPAPEAHAA